MIFKPFLKFHRITDISPEIFKKYDFRGLILDIDNTLSTHHGDQLVNGLEEWLSLVKNSGISLIILSNSKERRVKPFAEKIGLDFISLGLKPLPFGYIKAVRKLGLPRKNIAIIGDQLFTDSFGAHLSLIKPIILDPILPETSLSFKIRRRMEKILYKFYKFEV